MEYNGIVARKAEQALLQAASCSDQAEFIAVYGRRRVGKTYLISTLITTCGAIKNINYNEYVQSQVTMDCFFV